MYFSINRSVCVDHAKERQDDAFRSVALQYLKYRKHTCELCHFTEPRLQQVITKNGFYRAEDFRQDNFLVVCPHCFYGCRLGYAAVNDAIDVIYAPNVSQIALNQMNRLLTFYTDNEEGSYLHELKETLSEAELDLCNSISHSATSILIEMDDTKNLAKNAYKGFDPSNLNHIVSFLFQSDEATYQQRDRFFEPFRYMLRPKIARKLNKTYSHSVFKQFAPHLVQDKASEFIKMAQDGF
ncbi:TPA: hypothetical protein ACN33X_001442 [Vibrio parahaemolyticus]